MQSCNNCKYLKEIDCLGYICGYKCSKNKFNITQGDRIGDLTKYICDDFKENDEFELRKKVNFRRINKIISDTNSDYDDRDTYGEVSR